jgi:23S rRNA pseudouridine2605 synthase
MEERIQKILARAGFGSRRSCETLIIAGRVRINGKPAILGSKADGTIDKIFVDGRAIPSEPGPKIYIALNKPRGVLSDEDPQDTRQTVRDLVSVPGHLFTVGRLDLESEGLILLTNDGEMANRLTHPRYGHEKEYRVLLASHPDEKQLKAWRYGVVMEDGYKTAPADVTVESLAGKGTWLRIILREGKKRQIREVGKIIGLFVVKIIRIRIGGLELGGLKPREWRNLTPAEVTSLTKVTDRAKTGFPRKQVSTVRKYSVRTDKTRQNGKEAEESDRRSAENSNSAKRENPLVRKHNSIRKNIETRDSSKRTGKPAGIRRSSSK